MMSLPVWLPGPMFLLGALRLGGLCLEGLCLGVSVRGVSVQGVSVQGGLSGGSLPNRDPRSVKSGRCTCYRNAFLFIYSYRHSSDRISSDHGSFYSSYPAATEGNPIMG